MGVSWGGLATGIERGVGLGLALDQNQQAKEDRIYTRGLQERQMALSEEANTRAIDSHELNMAVANAELDEGRDQKKRTRMLNAIYEREQATRMFQRDLKAGAYKTQAELLDAMARLNQGNVGLMNLVGNKLINKNNAPGEHKQISRMFPHAPSGKLLFEVEITDKDGNKSFKPVTVGRSSHPDDPVALVDQKDIVGYLAKTKQILTDLDRMAIRRGDTGPIDRMRAGAEKTAERRADRADLRYEYALKAGLEGAKAQAKGLSGVAGATGLSASEDRLRLKAGGDQISAYFGQYNKETGTYNIPPEFKNDESLLQSILAQSQRANPNIPYPQAANEVLQMYQQWPTKEQAEQRARTEFADRPEANDYVPFNEGKIDEATIAKRTQEIFDAPRQALIATIQQAQGAHGPTGLTNAPNAPAQPPSNWKAPPAAKPYLKTITAAEQANHLPPGLLGRTLQQESSFDPEVISGRKVSHKGAVGIAQIMRKSHPNVDPTKPHASIKYAAKYLGELYQQFGNWEEALGAYNWGPKNVREKGLVNAPAETRQYVAKIMGDMGEMDAATAANPAGDYPKPTAKHLAALRAKPEMADQFKAKFGYLPSASKPASATGASGSILGIGEAAAADAPPSLPPAWQGSPGMPPMGYAGVQGLPGGPAGGMGLRTNPPPTGARRGLTFDSGGGERQDTVVNALGGVAEYFSPGAEAQRAVDNVRQLLRDGKPPHRQDAQARYDIETALNTGLLTEQETQQLTALLTARS